MNGLYLRKSFKPIFEKLADRRHYLEKILKELKLILSSPFGVPFNSFSLSVTKLTNCVTRNRDFHGVLKTVKNVENQKKIACFNATAVHRPSCQL